MTALSKYQRLECTGLWRPPPGSGAKSDPALAAGAPPDQPPGAPPVQPPDQPSGQPPLPQRREVFVAFGAATLVLSDRNNVALTHWSLPALTRLNPGRVPAIFSPDPEAGETLELEDADMIGAIEKVRAAISRGQPRAGRLRLVLSAGLVAAGLGVGIFWLPGALIRQTVQVVPMVKRLEIGQSLLTKIDRIAGPVCDGPFGTRALQALAARLPDGRRQRLQVLASGVATTQTLPGGIILLNRALIEDYRTPEVVAGYIVAAQLRAATTDPLERLLRAAGLFATLRLLTTGALPQDTLERYSKTLLASPPAPVANAPLLVRFRAARLASTPYAYALDKTGETTLGLIEADPLRGRQAEPVLSDADWVSLQGICGA